MITDIFAGNTGVAESYMEKTGFQEEIDEIRATLTGYIEKLKNNTFLKTDFSDLKVQTKEYLAKRSAYELSIASTDKLNKGFHFDPLKILEAPYFAILDI